MLFPNSLGTMIYISSSAMMVGGKRKRGRGGETISFSSVTHVVMGGWFVLCIRELLVQY